MSVTIDNFTKQLRNNLEILEDRASEVLEYETRI
jgi:hypothetical protein